MAEESRIRQELDILNCYSESVFLLASDISIDKKPVELLPAGRDYVMQCEWPKFQLEFRPFRLDITELLCNCGVSRVGNFWSGPSPAFEVNFGSRANIQEFLQNLEAGRVREGIEAILLPQARHAWRQANPESADVHTWKLDVNLDLLQLLPDLSAQHGIVQRVTSANCFLCASVWNERKVFDVGATLRWFRSNPQGGCAAGE